MEFVLIVEASESTTQPCFMLEGRKWMLSQKYNLDEDPHVPPFICVSYRWGLERLPHALDPGMVMSTNTLPSLAAAMRCAGDGISAFWTDVFCVPSDEGPRRQATLENMGYIYHRAAQVIVVLNERTLSTIQDMVLRGYDGEPGLRLLEQDDWAASLWTYQEIVNGHRVNFTGLKQATSNATAVSVEVEAFLNCVGYSLFRWSKDSGVDAIRTTQEFPNVSLLEDMMLDWRIRGLTGRCALVAFSGVARKRNPDAANYFYAILGTLTSSEKLLEWHSGPNLAEKMANLCEGKNDFSYVFTIAERDTDPKSRWRPRATLNTHEPSGVPMFLRPVLAWPCYGDGQAGHRDERGLWLHDMSTVTLSETISASARGKFGIWLARSDLDEVNLQDLEDAVHRAVVVMAGFVGFRTPLTTPHGFVYVMREVKPERVIRIVISHGIRWAIGAPGLVHCSDEAGEERYVVCAFVGNCLPLDEEGQTVLLE